jgi:hypothetical protein
VQNCFPRKVHFYLPFPPVSIYVVNDSGGNARGYLLIQSMLHPMAFEDKKQILITVENPFNFRGINDDGIFYPDNCLWQLQDKRFQRLQAIHFMNCLDC